MVLVSWQPKPGVVEVSTGTFVEHTVIGYTEHVDPF